MTLLFFCTWCSYWLFHHLAPMSSSYSAPDETLQIFSIELIFVTLSITSILSCEKIFSKNQKLDQKDYSNLFFNFLLILSTIGLIAIATDRIFVQNVDYSLGLTLSRTLWREQAKNREGFSSLIGLMGNILFPLCYVFLIGNSARISSIKKDFWAILLIIIFSSLTAGREGLFLLFFIILFRSCKKMTSDRFNFKHLVGLFLFIIFLFSLSSSFFQFRAKASDQSPYYYVSKMVDRLGGKFNPSCLDEDGFKYILCLPISLSAGTISYLTHSRWIAERESHDNRFNYQGATFPSIRYALKRLGIIKDDFSAWNESSYFFSFPMCLFYDFGWIGLIFFSLGIPFFVKLTLTNLGQSYFTNSLINFSLFALLISSPVVNLLGFMPFFFLLFLVAVILIIELLLVPSRKLIS